MAKKTPKEDISDMDSDTVYEFEDIEKYELISARQPDNSTKRRRIEELMEEKELRNSIYGDIYD